MNPAYNHGWYMVAFERDLRHDLTPAAVGAQRLVLIRTDGGVRVADAYCPHRGAHLGYGGRLDGDVIVCPFHGLRIQLGACSVNDLQVQERPALALGGLVFVRLSERFDNGFPKAIRRLNCTHVVVPGYEMHICARAALIVENGFDVAHFYPVHGIGASTLSTRAESDGSLLLTGKLHVGNSSAARAPEFVGDDESPTASAACREGELPLTLRAFSPGLSILEVGGAIPYTMIVAATPTVEGESTLRVSLALSREVFGEKPSQYVVDHLLENSRLGIGADKVIWEQMAPMARPTVLPEIDTAVLRFREFCVDFECGFA